MGIALISSASIRKPHAGQTPEGVTSAIWHSGQFMPADFSTRVLADTPESAILFEWGRAEPMSLGKRTLILALLTAGAASAYGLGIHYSPLLVYRVVEQALIEKAPNNMSGSELEKRFRAHLDAFPDGKSRLQRLLAVSRYLEKTQKLRQEELERILANGSIKPEAEIQ